VDVLAILGTAWALAMDAFAVAAAVGAGLERVTSRHVFRLAWHFGFFQAAMPVLGWLGGSVASSYTAAFAHWIASGLLVFIGARMFKESFRPKKQRRNLDPTRGLSLVGLSVATSIDALAVGISLGLIGVPVWIPAAVIGGVTIGMTWIGIRLGRGIGSILGPWAERAGGIALVLLGLRILVSTAIC